MDIGHMNILLGGAGVRGISYAGVQCEAERLGIKWREIGGVSAGAISGAFMASGFSSAQMFDAVNNLTLFKCPKRISLIEMQHALYELRMMYFDYIRSISFSKDFHRENNRILYLRETLNDFLKSNSSRMAVFDIDCIQEWIYQNLKAKGIKTFADCSLKLTAFDITRWRLAVFPDDAELYGYTRDNLPVCLAVAASSSIPFAFKPVTIARKEGDTVFSYSLIDGGVFETFPQWLVGGNGYKTCGFRIVSCRKSRSIMNALLDITKKIIKITAKKSCGTFCSKVDYIGEIFAKDIGVLDFDLSEKQKNFLFESGRKAAHNLFKSILSE